MAKPLSSLSGIVWDLDNTLYRLDREVEDAINRAVAQAAIALGAPLDIDTAMRMAHDSWLTHRFSAHVFMTQYGIAQRDLHFMTDKFLSGTEIEGCAALRAFFERIPQTHALITHSARPWALRTLAQLGLEKWFPEQRVFAYEDFDFESKAHSPLSFSRALAALDLPAEDTAMVEDTVDNLRVPRGLGMTTVFLHHGRRPAALPEFVDYNFANAREALAALAGENAALMSAL